VSMENNLILDLLTKSNEGEKLTIIEDLDNQVIHIEEQKAPC
jgi:uncharacterized protein (DUF2249 family)